MYLSAEATQSTSSQYGLLGLMTLMTIVLRDTGSFPFYMNSAFLVSYFIT